MTDRPLKPYRIIISEVRVYEIEVSSDTDYDLEDWALQGWQAADPADRHPDTKLIHRSIADVNVHEKSCLPWRKRVRIQLKV